MIHDAWNRCRPYLQDGATIPDGEWHKPMEDFFYHLDGATLTVLTSRPMLWKNRMTYLRLLAQIMDAAGIGKVYVLIPYSAMVLRKLARFMGFRQEGSLRGIATFHGQPIIMGLYGILRSEVNDAMQTSGLRRRRSHVAA